MKRLRTKIFVAAVVIAVLAGLLATPSLVSKPAQPSLEFSIVAPPKLQPKPAVFYIADPGSADPFQVTQRCYRAEFQIKNLGSGAIVFPYRGWFSLEIQNTNSPDWYGANQASLGVSHTPIPAGASQTFGVRIPIDAAKWRISTSFRRWHLPSQALNSVCRDFLGLDGSFGDQTIYDAEGPGWQITKE